MQPRGRETKSRRRAAALVRQYLEETGLSATAAGEALWWLSPPRTVPASETSQPEEAAAFEADYAALSRLHSFAWALMRGETGSAEEDNALRGRFQGIAPEDEAAIRAAWAALPTENAERITRAARAVRFLGPMLDSLERTIEGTAAAAALTWLRDVPQCRTLALRVRRFLKEHEAKVEKSRDGKLAQLLTGRDGQLQPDLYTWLERAGYGYGGPNMSTALAKAIGETLTELRVHEAERRAEEAEQRAAQAEQRAEESARQAKRRHTRVGTGLLRSLFTDQERIAAATNARQKLEQLPAADLAARLAFVPAELDTYECLVTVALGTIAHEMGLLNTHDWALANNRPVLVLGQEPQRVVIPYPGLTEIARALGDANPSRATRTSLERAINRLRYVPRLIAVPVRVPVYGSGKNRTPIDYIDDVEVSEDLWIKYAETLLTRGSYLKLHPVAVSTHINSFISLESVLPRYEAARNAIGAARLLDELGRADLYFRWLASNIAGGERMSEDRQREKAKREGEPPPVTVGELTIPKRLAEETLWKWTGLDRLLRKLGPGAIRERADMACAFGQELGSLERWHRHGKMYELVMPHPDRRTQDPAQTVLLPSS